MSTFKIISKKEFLKNNKKPNQEKIWNELARTWQLYRANRIPIVEVFLKDKKGKIIDLGCGNGRNIIKNPKITYYGVDFSHQQLKSAEKHIKKNKIKAKLFKSRLSKLNKKIFKNNFFYYGLFIGSLHCLETKEERKNALKEFYRTLKPNSEALISVWNSKDKRFSQLNLKNQEKGQDIYMSWYENRIPHMRYYYLFKKRELINLLNSVGFKILDFYKPREHDRFSKKNWIIKVGK